MFELLWLIPVLPFFSALMLVFFGRRIGKGGVAALGVGSMGLAALLTILIGINFLSSPPAGGAFTQKLWTWFEVGGFQPDFALRLDALSLVFMFVITFVGFLIHLYSSDFMKEDDGYPRFFTYMNLFVASMLMLVLGNNLVLLYLGWEGVGLCSYLLIGFWYKNPDNGYAARKAFVVTRVGDTAMAIGLFLLFVALGTLNIQEILTLAPEHWTTSAPMIIAITLLLVGGAVGKSAQLPLQTWLPDAMAGPSPVSALIHAATMVTAGVYLIARTHVLFELAPSVMLVVAAIGALTLLLAGFSALTQNDIKRVLAYSTISQIGYMFLALGVGAWAAGIFHFMTHAFFKALLFLGAGVIIQAMHHEHDMFKMGGLKDRMPTTFWTFLVASASLAALPLVTAGFYSKDAILWYAWSSGSGSAWLWLAGLVGAFITAIYTARMVFVTFYGKVQKEPDKLPSNIVKIPLIVLGVLSVIGGFVELPHSLGHVTLFSGFVEQVLPSVHAGHAGVGTELILQGLAAVLTLGGIYISYIFYIKNPKLTENLAGSPVLGTLQRLWLSGWGFDWLYDKLFVKPFVWIARINRRDFIDFFYTIIAEFTRFFHHLLSLTQTGRLRWYAMGIIIGAVITLTIIITKL